MKKAGILILVVLATIIGGMVVYHHSTIPKEEGVAYLKPAKIKPFSDLIDYASSSKVGEKLKLVELIDLPAEISDSDKNVSYFILPIGKKEVFALIQKPASGSAKAWIDLDMDQHLSDEKALTGVAKKYSEDRNRTWEYFDFGSIQLAEAHFAGGAFYLIADKKGSYISIRPVSSMKGKIRLGEHIYGVAVVDGDYDGKFNTLYEPSANYIYYGCDTFVVDYSYRFYDSGKMVPLGKYYKFTKKRYGTDMPIDGGKFECYYSVDLSEDGKTLRMQQAEPAMGTLKIGQNRRLSIRLFSDTATQWINFCDEVQLPVGRYQMHWGELTLTDKHEEQKLWADFCEDIRNGQFEIREGETFTLNPGPPFTVKTDISKKSNHTLSINAGLVGNEGEEYGLRLSRSAPAPQLKIFNEREEELHSGQMEYG